MATSSASLDRSPRTNWVEKAGGLPPYVRKIARAIHEKRGIPLAEAIPFAIGRIKRWAAGGDGVTAETRAKAAEAIAAWERLKGKAKLTEAADVVDRLDGSIDRDANLGVPTSLLLTWIAELDEPLVEAAGFADSLHPRDPHGRFMAKMSGLKKQGDKFTLHGIQVSNSGAGRGFRVSHVRGDLAHPESHRDAFTKDPAHAARLAVGRSMASTDPASLGGAKSYSSVADLPGNEGMAPRMKLDAPGVADLRQQLKRVNATLKSGKGPQAYAKKRKVEIEAQLGKLVEAQAMPDTARVKVRTRGGRTLDVSASHARRMHANGTLAPGQVRGDGSFTFDEAKHPRGGKGSASGGKFVAKGASGTEVRAVQRRVGARVDGAYGDKTKAAVERFQKSHGLVVDGIVGRQTVAALRGRRDAKRVNTGALSKRDREYLAGHIRGTGRAGARADATGKTKITSLVEAVAAPDFLERVRGLHPGEVARLPDGGAVKHEMSPDGRELWTSGRPSSYGQDGMNWREQNRTPEEAVADALSASASSTDPASLGGANRFGGYTRVTVNGRPARFVGVDASCSPLVRYDGAGTDPVAVTWPEIAPAPRLVEAHR